MELKKIMIVDDEPDQIFTVSQTLANFGDEYEIISAEGGKKCIDLLENNGIPDVILLDIMMSDMNGWEVYDRLKGNPLWEKIPVIFLTARTDRIAKSAGDFLGDDYIEKPFDREELKRRIDKLLVNNS
jgi:CheY-like chemotaxis protein